MNEGDGGEGGAGVRQTRPIYKTTHLYGFRARVRAREGCGERGWGGGGGVLG